MHPKTFFDPSYPLAISPHKNHKQNNYQFLNNIQLSDNRIGKQAGDKPSDKSK
jgi:hypothetical protein